MSVDDSKSRQFELKIWLSFSQVNLGRTYGQELFFSLFFFTLKLFFMKICAHSERYRNIMAGIFEIQSFSWQYRVSSVIGLNWSALFVVQHVYFPTVRGSCLICLFFQLFLSFNPPADG